MAKFVISVPSAPAHKASNRLNKASTAAEQYTPVDSDTDGRSTCAKAIGAALRIGPSDEIARHFSAADRNAMGKTATHLAEEMGATARAERSLGGRGPMTTTSIDAIKKIHAGDVSDLSRQQANALRKAAGVTSGRRNVLLVKGLDGVTRELDLGGTNTPKLPTVAAIRKALQRRQQFDPDRFFKSTDLPPQDTDEDDNGELPDTGAANNWSDEGPSATAVRADQLVGRHAASMRYLSRAPRVIADDEVEVAIRPRRPAPQTRSQNPNAVDGGSDETVEAIKLAQQNPQKLW